MTPMRLLVNIPYHVVIDDAAVINIVAESPEGFFGILPHRRDCIAALVPGILSFESEGQPEQYVAIDEGVLIKTGLDVLVSVRNAVSGRNLEDMKELVEQEYLNRSEQEQNVRLVLAKIENDFTRLFHEVHHE